MIKQIYELAMNKFLHPSKSQKEEQKCSSFCATGSRTSLDPVRTILRIRNSDYDADAKTNQEFGKQDFSEVKVLTHEHWCILGSLI